MIGSGRVLVAGASGRLGREVVRSLTERGHPVRALTRRPERLALLGVHPEEIVRADLLDPRSLTGCCRHVDAVISCAGAPLTLWAPGERRSYLRTDFPANRNLLAVAEAGGVRRFVYVSVHATPALARTAYVEAHARFAGLLLRSPIGGVAVRPTGFFGVFGDVLAMARRGLGLTIGSGEARTNPIHEMDVAELCVEALHRAEREIHAGGPEVFTRRQIVELAFDVLGARPRVLSVPPVAFRAVAAVARPLDRRLSEMLRFAVVASTTDVVAPVRGDRRLRAHFEALAGLD